MIYAIDVESFTVVHQFCHPYGGDYSGAGLALNGDGNLWVSPLWNRTVYLIDTGMPTVPAIVIDPVNGVVPKGETADIEVIANIAAIGKPGQDICKHLAITTNDPFNPELYVDIVIHIEPGPMISEVTATSTIGEPRLTVEFVADVEQGAKPIRDMWWDFGDGSDLVHEARTVHVYSELGEYEAMFHVVEPDKFDIGVPADQEMQIIMTVSNPGRASLTFNVEALPRFAHGPEWIPYTTSKRTAFAGEGSGGPDNYGYIWIDSNQTGGPEFDWVEISEIGTRVNLRNEDGIMVPLGFAFPFYGEIKTEIGICDNGYLTFDRASLRGFFRNGPIPHPGKPNDMLTPFWYDLNSERGGGVYYYYDSAEERFIVEYTNVPAWDGGTSYTFQVVLYPDGTIIFQYLEMKGEVGRATVGIENATGEDGLLVAFSAPYIEDGLAIGFAPIQSMVKVNPQSGYLVPGGIQDVVLTFDAPITGGGTYSLYLQVSTNDPFRPFATIPVTIKFNAAPSIVLTAPEGGGQLHGTCEITWTAADPDDPADALKVDLYWSRDGGEWNEIAKGLPNTGSYMWNTAEVGVGGDAFRVRIVVTDPAGETVEAISEPFALSLIHI